MRMKAASSPARIARIGGLVLAAWVAGCGGGEGDGRTGAGNDGGGAASDDRGAAGGDGADSALGSLGRDCGGPCTGTWCASGDLECSDSDLDSNNTCVGTVTGMYCSRSCRSDDDCATPQRSMRCIVSCPGEPGGVPIAGICWSEDDYAFLTKVICNATLGAGGTRGAGGASGTGGVSSPSGTAGTGLFGEGCPDAAPEANAPCTTPNPNMPMYCRYADTQCVCTPTTPQLLCV